MRGRAPYQTLRFDLGGGLNLHDAPDRIGENEAVAYQNFAFAGRGRISPRFGVQLGSQVGNSGDKVIGIFPFPHGLYLTGTTERTRGGIVVVQRPSGVVAYYSVDQLGNNPSATNTLWNGTGTDSTEGQPVVVTATEVGRMLFVAAYRPDRREKQLPMRMLVAEGTSITRKTPSFRFEGEGSTGASAKPAIVASYNNMLLMAGYGTENDPFRPETIRYSYIGLDFDPGGRGDAGADEDSMSLFDTDDYFQVAERGAWVISMAAAAGRLIIATPHRAYTLFGYSRNDFTLELLDNQRGCVATHAMIPAAGYVWWWSPLGPVRWGGSVEDLSYPIQPAIDEMRREDVFAGHSIRHKEVRWFRPVGSETRAFGFNYEVNQWQRHLFALPMFAFGHVSDEWSGETEVTPPPPELQPPTNLRVQNRTTSGFVLRWDNAETGTGVETTIWIKRASDASFPADPIVKGSGVDSHTFGSLQTNTAYDVRLRHRLGSSSSVPAEATFSTLAPAAAPSAPSSLTGQMIGGDPTKQPDGSTGGEGGYIHLSWQNSASDGLRTIIQRRQGTAAFVDIGTTPINATSFNDSNIHSWSTYDYRVRHKREIDGVESGHSNTVGVYTGSGGQQAMQ